jgi:hypothetical protein
MTTTACLPLSSTNNAAGDSPGYSFSIWREAELATSQNIGCSMRAGRLGVIGVGRLAHPDAEALLPAASAAGDSNRRPSSATRAREAVAARALGARRTRRARVVWRSRREGLRAGCARARHLGRHSALGAGPPGQVPAVLDGRMDGASVAAGDRHARHARADRAVDHRRRVPVGVGLASAAELDRSGWDARFPFTPLLELTRIPLPRTQVEPSG